MRVASTTSSNIFIFFSSTLVVFLLTDQRDSMDKNGSWSSSPSLMLMFNSCDYCLYTQHFGERSWHLVLLEVGFKSVLTLSVVFLSTCVIRPIFTLVFCWVWVLGVIAVKAHKHKQAEGWNGLQKRFYMKFKSICFLSVTLKNPQHMAFSSKYKQIYS